MSKAIPCLGIRREDKNRWERRAPLAPLHVALLVKKGIKVIVQPSTLRTYPDKVYYEAGAVIQDDLSEANTIVGVKEVPSSLLFPNKTYMFFSHTIKAQPYNMPMLDDILQKNIRLIDYERITDQNGRRLVRFGRFAGYAGMIDMLHALGDRLLAKGYSTPFLHVAYSYCYSQLENAKDAVRSMGEELSHIGLPKALYPMTFVFTSDGAVAQGALEIFKLLPHIMLTPEQMIELVKNKDTVEPNLNILYGCVVQAADMVSPNDPNKKFDKTEYYQHPERYHSTFCDRLGKYISVIVNCMYWDSRFPRLITIKQMADLDEKGDHKLIGVADISADIQGSLEFLMKTTSIDQPLFIYDPKTQEIHESTTDRKYMYRHGIMFLAVDNLPTEFPREATQWFGDHLSPFMESIVKSDIFLPFSEQVKDLPQEILRAVVTSHSQLTPSFQYITKLREIYEKSVSKVLILGAGPRTASAVEYLCRNSRQHRVTIADKVLRNAQRLTSMGLGGNVKAVPLDLSNLDQLVRGQNVVVSMLSTTDLPTVEEVCLNNKVHLVTASYITSLHRKTLEDKVREAGLTFLYEVGLDPGIDHLEAVAVIDEIKKKGGKLRSLVSWCGGLPTPENSDNGIGFKLSWSPHDILAAAVRDARYKENGKIVEISGNDVFKHRQQVEIFPAFHLDGVPNRDCLSYATAYGVEDTIRTIFRGSLRYRGWCQTLDAASEIGLLRTDVLAHLLPAGSNKISWNEALRWLLLHDSDSDFSNISTPELLTRRLRTGKGHPHKGFDEDINLIIQCFHLLGLFDSNSIVSQKGCYMEAFCDLLAQRLAYGPGERDMVIMHHIFDVEWKNGNFETQTSTLVVYGEPADLIDENKESKSNGDAKSHHSPEDLEDWAPLGTKHLAMSKLGGLSVAIATECILDDIITKRGVIRPTSQDIAHPILKALSNEGIFFKRKTHKYTHSELLYSM